MMRAYLAAVQAGLDALIARFVAFADDLDRRGRAGDFGKWPWQDEPGGWPWQKRPKKHGE